MAAQGGEGVASEVRSPAQRSTEAAREIEPLIGRSREQVEQGTALADQAGRTMGESVVPVRRVTDIVAGISSGSVERRSGAQQVGHAFSPRDQVAQQNAALVEDSAAAAESLKGQAQPRVQAAAVFELARQPPVASAARLHEGACRGRPRRPVARRRSPSQSA